MIARLVQNDLPCSAFRPAFFMGFATAGYGRSELGFEVFGKFVEFGIAVDFDSLLRCIADHIAVVAPSKVLV